MGTKVEFIKKSEHKLKYDKGDISIKPALSNDSSLYVIYNNSTDREVYVGTAKEVKDRFKQRTEALREWGFKESQIEKIKIYVIQIKVNGDSSTPGDKGVTKENVDVEKLLIRTYIEKRNKKVRNVDKTTAFINRVDSRLEWELKGFEGDSKYSLDGRETL